MPVLRICIPAKIHMHAKCVVSLLNCKDLIKFKTGYDVDMKVLCGKSNIDQARSMLTTDFYNECKPEDVMLFIDSDHIFSIDDIYNVLAVGGDVGVGVYPNAVGNPTCHPMDNNAFFSGIDNRVKYAGTGFMLIKHTILTKVAKWLADNDIAHASIDTGQYSKVIPFFKQRIVKSEIVENRNDWIGEDYTFCWLVRQCGGEIRGFLTKTLGHEVTAIRIFYPEDTLAVKNGPIIATKLPLQIDQVPVKTETLEGVDKLIDLTFNNICKIDQTQNKEIVYFCGSSAVKFSPDVKGLGGSEQGVIGLSRSLAKLGYNVKVYGNVHEGIYDDVEYIDSVKFDRNKKYNILILWRSFGWAYLPVVKADHIYIDLHDGYSSRIQEIQGLENVEKIFVKSEWHKQLWLPSNIASNKFAVIKNGINIELYDNIKKLNISRNRYKVCYTSCYTRGLITMLKECWPLIQSRIPEAELHICYGYDLCSPDVKKQVDDAFEYVKNMNVFNHGRLPHEKVAELRASCNIHLYLCTSPQVETDCLSVRESFYIGCIPVVFDEGVFKERKCIAIPTKHDSLNSFKLAAAGVIQLLSNQDQTLTKIRTQTPLFAESSWDDIAKQWSQYLPQIAL